MTVGHKPFWSKPQFSHRTLPHPLPPSVSICLRNGMMPFNGNHMTPFTSLSLKPHPPYYTPLPKAVLGHIHVNFNWWLSRLPLATPSKPTTQTTSGSLQATSQSAPITHAPITIATSLPPMLPPHAHGHIFHRYTSCPQCLFSSSNSALTLISFLHLVKCLLHPLPPHPDPCESESSYSHTNHSSFIHCHTLCYETCFYITHSPTSKLSLLLLHVITSCILRDQWPLMLYVGPL